MPAEKKKLRHTIPHTYKGSLCFKFIVWISIILIITLGAAALYAYKTQQNLLENSLRRKANALGQFIALISPEAIYSYNVTRLDRFVKQISNDVDVSFAQIRTIDGQPITTFLPEDIDSKMIDKWFYKNLTSSNQLRDLSSKPIILEFPIRDEKLILGWVFVGLDTSRIEQITRDAIFDLIQIYSLIVFFLGNIIFVIFKLQVLHPVYALSRGASRIAEGILDKDVPII
jgi:sensor histidine kinase regulating citrate/malate metabolism